MSGRNDHLSVSLDDERLVIAIGIDTLANAIKWHPSFERYDEESGEFLHPEITHTAMFAEEIVRALEIDEEDGATLVHRMLDKAAEEAIEQGAEGIELP